MKKLFTLLFLFVSATSYAQIAYYDALALKAHLIDGELTADDEVFTILDRYVEPSRANSKDEISLAIRETRSGDPNPFIEIAGGQQAGTFNTTALRNLASAAGDLNVTSLADGLAQFLIERSKEELSVAFFDDFKDDLQELPELKILFPTTASFIENIEAYNYASFIQTLREGFLADLVSLPTSLRNLRKLNASYCPNAGGKCTSRLANIEQFFNNNDKSILFIASAIAMDSLQSGASIADILQAIAQDDQLSKFPSSNISNGLSLANVFSYSLRSEDDDRIWITREELKKLANPAVLKLYFGLIYQQVKENDTKIVLKNPDRTILLTSLIKPEKINLYFDYLQSVINSATEINRIADEIRSKREANEKFTADEYVNYLNASVDVVHALMNWDVFDITPPPEFYNILSITRSAVSVYYNVKAANYSSAISNTFIILDKTLNDTYKHKDKVLRYGSFMASVVQAENGEQVKNAIQAVALPAGSASIKKNSQWNISLNGYLGGFGGTEYLADKTTNQTATTWGVSAPIGICVSHNVGTASITGFASVLDLGAVASYRLNDSETEDLPDLTLQNILAPGVGVVLGFPKWPVSLGFVSQIGPSLREIDSAATTVSDKMNRRHYFFLAVDIPLLNFYTRPK